MIVTRHTGKHKNNHLTQTEAAKILGVTREHLNRVLRGHRASRRLLGRYTTLCARKSPARESQPPKPNP